MATWQYDLQLIPRAAIITRYGFLPDDLGEEEFSGAKWWSGTKLLPGYEELLDSFLSRFESWDRKRISWGREDSNLVEIFFEDGNIEEIFVRIDARKLDAGFAEQVIRFAKFCECLLLLVEQGKLLEPDLSSLNKEVRNSRAYQFVMDPKTFFDSISKTR